MANNGKPRLSGGRNAAKKHHFLPRASGNDDSLKRISHDVVKAVHEVGVVVKPHRPYAVRRKIKIFYEDRDLPGLLKKAIAVHVGGPGNIIYLSLS